MRSWATLAWCLRTQEQVGTEVMGCELAGIKADKADKAAASGPASASAPAAEILLTPARDERPPRHRSRKGGSVGGVCYLSMGMVVLLMGLVFASVYIYRYFFLAQLARDNLFHCGVLYEDSLSSQMRTRMELEEDVKIYLEENYERINVPVPQFGGGDPADIIHDFQRVRLICGWLVGGWDLG